MKIIVLDGYTENPGDLSWDELGKLGELTVYDRTESENEVIDRIGDAEVVITNKTPISRNIIDMCTNIKFISVLATGYNVVDTAYAKEHNIPVSNVPAYGTASVSQFAIALLLEAANHIGEHYKVVHHGAWVNSVDWCFWNYPLIELAGKTLGIIGFGRIGQATAKVAKALGMNIIANDIVQTDSGKELAEYVDLDTLFANSDAIILHCNLTPKNTEIINAENIKKMKDGVIIVNNARGQLVNEQDLADALNSGKVAVAGLDVVSTEPMKADNPLLTAKNAIITPHISWAAKESRQRIMDATIENVSGFLNNDLINVVNA